MIVFLDVRTADEHGYDDLGSALNIPHDEVPSRLGELIGSEKIFVFCRSGARAEYATKILLNAGFNAQNIKTVKAAKDMMSKEAL